MVINRINQQLLFFVMLNYISINFVYFVYLRTLLANENSTPVSFSVLNPHFFVVLKNSHNDDLLCVQLYDNTSYNV